MNRLLARGSLHFFFLSGFVTSCGVLSALSFPTHSTGAGASHHRTACISNALVPWPIPRTISMIFVKIVKVKPYGSFVTGLSLPWSDLDLVICLPKVRNISSLSKRLVA